MKRDKTSNKMEGACEVVTGLIAYMYQEVQAYEIEDVRLH
jgi:hypothetical protein